MDYTLIVKNSGLLFDRYKDLSLMELVLSLHNLVEYYEMDFKNVEISEMIFRMQKQLFIKAYCKHFIGDNAIVAQNFFKKYTLGQLLPAEWVRYLFVEDIDNYYRWLFNNDKKFY